MPSTACTRFQSLCFPSRYCCNDSNRMAPNRRRPSIALSPVTIACAPPVQAHSRIRLSGPSSSTSMRLRGRTISARSARKTATRYALCSRPPRLHGRLFTCSPAGRHFQTQSQDLHTRASIGPGRFRPDDPRDGAALPPNRFIARAQPDSPARLKPLILPIRTKVASICIIRRQFHLRTPRT